MIGKSSLTAALLSLCLAQFGDLPAQDPARRTGPNTPTVHVNVDIVLVNATVTDGQNRFVVGLDKNDFQIWEDKVEQKIAYFSSEDVPMSVGIIFDISGSMKDKMSHARDAAAAFLAMGSPDDEYFLLQFNDRPEMIADFTTDINRVQRNLVFSQAKGMTALYDAVYLGLSKLKQGANPKKALLLITDGEDNRSRYTYSNVRDYVKEQDAMLFAIGIVDSATSQLSLGRSGRAILEELTELTGGYAFFPESMNDLERDCEKIAVELKNQYLIGYTSTNSVKDGKWRKLRVKVTPPKELPLKSLSVRARSGYYAPMDTAAVTNKEK
ncbi:MAG TPA: VWA domain-containing protein [Terriglobia bacterium]|nr:VWA domain-containing protein [Terriglobia bacterium]